MKSCTAFSALALLLAMSLVSGSDVESLFSDGHSDVLVHQAEEKNVQVSITEHMNNHFLKKCLGEAHPPGVLKGCANRCGEDCRSGCECKIQSHFDYI